MAVEIKELVIKAIITPDDADHHSYSTSPQEITLQTQQQLVQECVNQVMKIIKQSQNR